MSDVIATMANALIEFILSLIRDPEAAAEFEADPEGTLESRGLQNVDYNDLCAAMPMVYDDPQVMLRGDPAPLIVNVTPGQAGPDNGPGQVIQQLHEIITNTAYVTNNSTILDQSVNQDLWAEGDILQLFDNEAIIASGEGSTAAGRDVVDDDSTDSSTTVTVGRDAVVDSDVDTDTTVDSHNSGTAAPSPAPATGTGATATPAPATESSSEEPATVDPAPAPESEAPADPAPAPAVEPAAEPEPTSDTTASYQEEADPYAADDSTALSEPIPLEESTAESEF